MKFIATRADFLRELTVARDAAEKKVTQPILACVLLEASGETVTLTASDLELSLRCVFPAKVQEAGSLAVPAHKLHSFLKTLNDGDVEVKATDTHWLSIASGRNRTRIAGMSRESFPDLPCEPPAMIKLSASRLLAMSSRVIFCVSKEESRFTLQAAKLLIDEESMTLVATDGHRLGYARHEGKFSLDGPLGLLVPKRVLGEIGTLMAGGDDMRLVFSMDDTNLFFRVGERMLIARKVTGKFPDYERVLPRGNTAVAKIVRADFQGALARVSEFADETSCAVRFRMGSGEMVLSALSIDHGESEESVPCHYDGPCFEVGFNGSYVDAFLRVADGLLVELHLKDAMTAGEFRPAAQEPGTQYRYVVMPMRI